MATLSDLIIQNPDCNSFDELRQIVIRAANDGAITLHFDIKPDFRDTPRDWMARLEWAFYTCDKYPDKWGYMR